MMTRKELEAVAVEMAEESMQYFGYSEEEFWEEVRTCTYSDLLNFVYG